MLGALHPKWASDLEPLFLCDHLFHSPLAPSISHQQTIATPHNAHRAGPQVVLKPLRKVMYTEGVAPSGCQLAPVPPRPSRKGGVCRTSCRTVLQNCLGRKQLSPGQAPPQSGGTWPHLRWPWARRVSRMFSKQPSRSMSTSTRSSRSSVASRCGVCRRQASSML